MTKQRPDEFDPLGLGYDPMPQKLKPALSEGALDTWATVAEVLCLWPYESKSMLFRTVGGGIQGALVALLANQVFEFFGSAVVSNIAAAVTMICLIVLYLIFMVVDLIAISDEERLRDEEEEYEAQAWLKPEK